MSELLQNGLSLKALKHPFPTHPHKLTFSLTKKLLLETFQTAEYEHQIRGLDSKGSLHERWSYNATCILTSCKTEYRSKKFSFKQLCEDIVITEIEISTQIMSVCEEIKTWQSFYASTDSGPWCLRFKDDSLGRYITKRIWRDTLRSKGFKWTKKKINICNLN